MSQREKCHACGLPLGDRTFRVDPIVREPFVMCDTCMRLYELGLIDYDGRLLVERIHDEDD
jgi:hypothetical protein